MLQATDRLITDVPAEPTTEGPGGEALSKKQGAEEETVTAILDRIGPDFPYDLPI